MKTKLLFFLAVVAFISTSCIYQDIRVPGPTNKVTNYNFDTNDFKVLGTVEAQGTIITWFGLVQTGGNGETVLYEKAKKTGADDITNYTYNLEAYSILTFIYNEATWKARATAIQYTAKAKGHANRTSNDEKETEEEKE